jgi:hypothetical protein
MSEEADDCFVLPLREAVAHFAGRNTRRSTDTKRWTILAMTTMAILIRALTY